MTNSESLRDAYLGLLQNFYAEIEYNSALYNGLSLVLILLAASVMHMLGKLILNSIVYRGVKKTKTQWDDALHEHGFFNRLVHLIPALTVFLFTHLVLDADSLLIAIVIKAALLYMMFVALLSFSALLNTLEDWYNTTQFAKQASITGFIQVAKLMFAILFILFGVSLIVDRSPLLLLSGLTAIAAVLLLIFRDTILGFVAGIQITANRLFANGDWIQINRYSVDGEIIELGLTNVKVRNWDNTISTLPTYTLTNESIKNWRGMQESGGRRIKRSIYIDMHSIELYDNDSLQQVAKIRYIAKYIEDKITELREYHKDHSIDENDLLNRRALTNIGTFRAYLTAYLTHHPNINQEMTLMIRQLPPSELGLPLEIYCFCSDKAWVNYEMIQADIFDHILAMLPLFKLRAYQRDAQEIKVPE